MREIKFRAWYKKNKRWLPDNAIISFTKNDGFLRKNDIELSQLTGLLDKYKKEIYEKDILSNEDGSYTVVIDWCEESCGYAYFKKVERKDNERLMINPSKLTLEVIGNVFENPELLTNK